jgi:hypothetical protein
MNKIPEIIVATFKPGRQSLVINQIYAFAALGSFFKDK